VTALRVCLLEPKTASAIYRAAWSKDEPISNPEVLARILIEAGFDGKKLIRDVTEGPRAEGIKLQLKANNDEAIQLGICGVRDLILWMFLLFEVHYIDSTFFFAYT
jgi:2-hydroxychromene-2-carboxylate isomerase